MAYAHQELTHKNFSRVVKRYCLNWDFDLRWAQKKIGHKSTNLDFLTLNYNSSTKLSFAPSTTCSPTKPNIVYHKAPALDYITFRFLTS